MPSWVNVPIELQVKKTKIDHTIKINFNNCQGCSVTPHTGASSTRQYLHAHDPRSEFKVMPVDDPDGAPADAPAPPAVSMLLTF